MTKNVLERIADEFGKKGNFANPICIINNPSKMIIMYDNAEDKTKRVVELFVIYDENENAYIDITRYNNNCIVIYHAIVDVNAPSLCVDVNTQFCGDADCALISAIGKALDIDIYGHVINKYKTVVDDIKQLKKLKDDGVNVIPEDKIGEIIAKIILSSLDDESEFD